MPGIANISARGLLFAWLGALLLVGLLVVLSTVRDYGVTWDEWVHSTHGERVLAYFRSGGADRSALDWLDMNLYGPVFDLVSAAIYQFAPGLKYLVRHHLIALTGLACLPALVLLANEVEERYVAFLASVALVAMPRFYGDCFNNPKDIPFACGILWSMYALVRLARRRPWRWRDALLAGVAFGAALALRPGGLLMLGGYSLLVAALVLAIDGRPAVPRGSEWLPIAGKLAAVVAIAWTLMIAAWPWALQSPIWHPLEAVRASTRFAATYPVLFEGREWMSDALPRRYLPELLAITTPPATLVFSLVGLVAAALAWRKDRRSGRALLGALATGWLLLPIAGFLVLKPNVYDGIRHFLFLLPALAILAALGAVWLYERARALSAAAGTAVAAASLAALLVPTGEMVALHPYQQTYFNAFVGGLAGASGSYETDYWLGSYKEAMEWVNRQPRPAGRSLKVLVAASDYSVSCAEEYQANGVEIDHDDARDLKGPLPAQYDYYIAATRYRWSKNYPDAPIVHVVGRRGATLTVVKGQTR